MGAGGSARGEDDEEHTNRYWLASSDHFDDDDEFLRDPRNREFYVAPDTIGDDA